jgi:V8-like Glu-specific endopeptidase
MIKFSIAISIAVLSTAQAAVPKVIYGIDNRLDIKDVKNQKLVKVAKSVAGMVSKYSYSTKKISGINMISFTDVALLSDSWGGDVCRDEKFANQPTVAACTGFFIGEDKLVTAGHCLLDGDGEVKNGTNENCKGNDWIFDYQINKGESKVKLKQINAKSVYNCKKIIIAKVGGDDDFAIIQLDRKVEGIKALVLRSEGKIEVGANLAVIGHPSGLPKKVADGAKVLHSDKKEFFSTSLDTFGGNSGSPVFNLDTMEVEGILVRGKTDYVYATGSCQRVNICSSDGLSCLENDEALLGEEVSRITEINAYL